MASKSSEVRLQSNRRMVSSCVAYNCTTRSRKESGISFFGFPLSNPPLLKKWILAIRREGLRPSRSTRICSKHFDPESFQCRPDASYPLLRQDAVPSVFDFSMHNNEDVGKNKKKITTTEKLLLELKDEYPSDNEISPLACCAIESVDPSKIVAADHCYDGPKLGDIPFESCQRVKREIVSAVNEQNKRFKEELAKKRLVLRRKIRTLQQQIRRRDKTVRRLKRTINEMKDQRLDNEAGRLAFLRANFNPVQAEIFENELRNSEVKAARRYSDTVKEFAITLYAQSPSAYDYMRTIFTLPSRPLIKRWVSESHSKSTDATHKNAEVIEPATPSESEIATGDPEVMNEIVCENYPNKKVNTIYIEGLGEVEYINVDDTDKLDDAESNLTFFANNEKVQIFQPITAISNVELENAIRSAQLATSDTQQISFGLHGEIFFTEKH